MALLFPNSVGIDRGRQETSMPQPALHQIERDTGLDRRHAEAMASSLGGRLGAVDARRAHDGMDMTPRGRAAPGP